MKTILSDVGRTLAERWTAVVFAAPVAIALMISGSATAQVVRGNSTVTLHLSGYDGAAAPIITTGSIDAAEPRPCPSVDPSFDHTNVAALVLGLPLGLSMLAWSIFGGWALLARQKHAKTCPRVGDQ